MSELYPIPDHIEAHLGRIDPSVNYWQLKQSGGSPLQILSFPDKPSIGSITLCTLGLSTHELCSEFGHLKQELIIAVWERFVCDELAATIAYIGKLILNSHTAICVGDVIGPSGPILKDSELEAILCLPPNIFPPEFATCNVTEPPTNFMWLVPISASETIDIRNFGLDHLLSRWRHDKTDLLDFFRKTA